MKEAPKTIPMELYDGYSMAGRINVGYSYRNDCSDEIQEMMNANYTQEEFDKCIERVRKRELNYYTDTDSWLYDALDKYSIKGKHICIAGSAYPWYEAVAIVFGARKCSVIEYSDRESFHPLIEYIKPEQLGIEKYDACFSISSYEHDGLGRYGDPLQPDGDIEAMKKMKDLLKKDSLMYLAVPMGYDYVYFNVHRVYGRLRFPKLIEGWEKIDEFGFFENSFSNAVNTGEESPYQPVCILRNS
jgi:hypothetical protein